MDFALGVDREESMKKAFAYTQKALSLDDSQPVVYTTMEFMYGFMRRHEEAIASAEKAVRIAPGSAYAQFSLGRALNFACRDREALMHLEIAVRMNPIPPHKSSPVFVKMAKRSIPCIKMSSIGSPTAAKIFVLVSESASFRNPIQMIRFGFFHRDKCNRPLFTPSVL